MTTMRILMIISLVNIFSLASHAQPASVTNRFTLNGKVIGQDTGIIRLSYRGTDNKLREDTFHLTNAKFTFTGFVNEPTIAILRGKVRAPSIDDPNAVELFLEPAEMTITIQVNDFAHASVTGSATQSQLSELLKKEDPILKKRRPLDDAWSETITALQKDENNQILKSKVDSIHNAFQPYSEKLKKIDYQFIGSHPDSYVSPYILIPYIDDLSVDSAKAFYTNFTERVKSSRYGISVIEEIKRKMVALPGDIAEDFITKDINGNPLSLSSFKGQNIVLLDFWASWCIPCRRNNPHLIELYKQYHSKGLEIIGIAMDDDNPDAWKEAISKDGTGIWHQVLQGKDKEMIMKRLPNKNDIGEQYGIVAIPVKVLIDKNGKIVGRYEGDNDEELEKALATLIK